MKNVWKLGVYNIIIEVYTFSLTYHLITYLAFTFLINYEPQNIILQSYALYDDIIITKNRFFFRINEQV